MGGLIAITDPEQLRPDRASATRAARAAIAGRATTRSLNAASGVGTERPDLAALGAKWQEQLRLQDWRIQWEYARELYNSSAQPVNWLCSYLPDNKTARIQIRDPENPIPGAPEPTERSVVGALARLHFAPFGNPEAEEPAAEAMAEALFAPNGREMSQRAFTARQRAAAASTSRAPTHVALAAVDRAMGVQRGQQSALRTEPRTAVLQISNISPATAADVARARR
ncbi:hypothetical protein WMF45_00200 [Sorangium sp. So ce448]|uniref:hypothetical protein n=1 Tax=Sorangium sp. So ce448 TaxID=3133314 RepID=UPI003F5D89FA